MKMKKNYVKPQMEEMEFDVRTVMMANSMTNVGGEGEPDANERRGTWGNRWE